MKNDQYAVVKIGASQYLVSPGEEIEIDKISQKEGETVKFDEVLLTKEEKKIKFGQPLIKGATVEATVVKHIKGPKVRVATYRAKSRYRRVKGFRPQLTKIKITKIKS